MSETLFIEPLDVLYLRGNRLFGAAGGDDAAAQMPPWPTVAAGAIRSRMLVDEDEGLDPAAFARGEAQLSEAVSKSLGTPQAPGAFRLARFALGRKREDGAIEPLFPLPADRLATGNEDAPKLHSLRPCPLPDAVSSSAPLRHLAVLRAAKTEKPCGGFFLTGKGLAAWLRDEPPQDAHVIHAKHLWKTEPRLGIALAPGLRAAEEGRIYTSDAVNLAEGIGLLAEVHGADGLLPRSGLVRLGGDGHGAEVAPARAHWPEPDWGEIAATGRFRLLLISPGLFADGWRLPLTGARLVAAALDRAEIISGWDLAKRKPKPAQRFAPAGSVYWFEGFAGDVAALQALAQDGLPYDDAARRAEGFNACLIGNWRKETNDV